MNEHRASSVERRGPVGLRVPMLILALLLVLGACSTGGSPDDPPNLNLGRDVCERCGMIIEDARFASGYRLADGTSKVFDDIGGMLVWAKLAGDLDEARMWVHDYHSMEWIEASAATFVISGDIMTPMAFGIAAFSDPTAAAEFAGDGEAHVHTWEDVLEMAQAGEIEDHHGASAGDADVDGTGHEHGDEPMSEHNDS